MKYLCGCSRASKASYTSRVEETGFGTQALTFMWFDKQGFEICPEHGQRLTNWRTIDKANKKGTPTSLTVSSSGFEDKRDNRDPEAVYAEMQASRLSQKNGHA